MRISVCEFLRMKTGTEWFYVRPGHWCSDRAVMTAERIEDGVFKLRRKGTAPKVLEYFEGRPSAEVRAENREAGYEW